MATKRFVCKSSLRDWAEFLHEFFQNNRLSLLPMKFKGKTYQLTEIDLPVEGVKDGKIITLKMNGTESKNLLVKEKVKRISPAVQIHFQRRFLEKEIGDFAVKVNNILKHNLKTVAMQATTETTCTLETFNDGFNDAITALEKWLRSEDERMFIEGVRTYVEAMPLIDKITRKMVAGKPSGVTAFGVNPKTLEVKEVQTFWAIPGTKSDDPDLNKEKPIEEKKSEQGAVNASTLSDREKEVVDLVRKGYERKEIADKLMLTPAGVDSHVKNISVKLGLEETKSIKKVKERVGE